MPNLISVVVIAIILIQQATAIRIHSNGALNTGLKYRGLSLTETDAQPEPQYFDQKVDHFDPTNKSTFKQLYYVNDTYWTGPANGGPIFIMLGGEGPVSPAYVLNHFVITEYAAKFGALVVAVEHRFYGQSMPAPDLSTNNLRLLSTTQALADYAEFRHFIATKYNATSSKWISFGGSYSGSLSAWFRLKYPHLIDGSIATSAPVLAQLNFPEYFEVVQNSLGPSCSQRVGKATAIITQLLATSQGRQRLQQLFTTCDPIVSNDDVSTFMSSLTDGICEIVQYNNDNNNYLPFNIERMCAILEEGGATDEEILQAYVNFNNIWNQFSGENCTSSSYSEMINEMKNVAPKSDVAAARSWTWQTCTEYGYFQTGDSKNQPFSNTISLQWFLKQCEDIYGAPFSPNIVATNDIFGAKNLKETRVVLPNGSVDPWHILGITSPSTVQCDQVNETIRFINGTAHCADLYPPSPKDVPELTETRKIQVTRIQEWLSTKC